MFFSGPWGILRAVAYFHLTCWLSTQMGESFHTRSRGCTVRSQVSQCEDRPFPPLFSYTKNNKTSNSKAPKGRPRAKLKPKAKRIQQYTKRRNQLMSEINQLRYKDVKLADARLMEAIEDRENSRDVVTERMFNVIILGYAAKKSLNDSFRAEELLQMMHDLSNSSSSLVDKVRPTTFTYNAVMKAWVNTKNIDQDKRMESITNLVDEMNERGLEKDVFTYNLLISIACSADEAQRWVESIKNDNLELDRETYVQLFKLYARKGKPLEAEQLLFELVDELERRKKKDLKGATLPEQCWINNIIDAWAKSEFPQAGERADYWLEWSKHCEKYEEVEPDTATYNQAMNAQIAVDNEDRMIQLLSELESAYEETGTQKLAPDTITYTTAIKGMSDPSRALEILKYMERVSEEMGTPNMAPNRVTYTSLIQKWALLKTKEGLFKATEILDSMPMRPDSETYAVIIFGWTTSGLYESGPEAEQLLEELESLPRYLQQRTEFSKIYNSVIFAYARAGHHLAPERAEALLERLEWRLENQRGEVDGPDRITYMAVASAYARACVADASERCDILLQKLARQGGKPNRSLYNAILNAIARSSQPEAINKVTEIVNVMQSANDPDLLPDIVTYSSVIDCLKRSKHPKAAEKAEEILAEVEKRYYEEDDKLLKPSQVFYSGVMQAWAKTASDEGALKAEKLLRRNDRRYSQDEKKYSECKATTITYDALIDAVARSGRPNAAAQAEDLLDEMMQRYSNGEDDLKPTQRSLHAVMLAYRQDMDEGATKAEKLLNRMQDDFNLQPNSVSFNTVMGALAESNQSNAAERAQALLDNMEEQFESGNEAMRPSTITYGAVMKAWLKRRDEKGGMMAHAVAGRLFEAFDDERPSSPRGDGPNEVLKVVEECNKSVEGAVRISKQSESWSWLGDLTEAYGSGD